MNVFFIKAKWLLFFGVQARALIGIIILYSDSSCLLNDKILIHEYIHIKQQRELLIIFFPIWYIIEGFIKVVCGKTSKSISFEKEAYENENYYYFKNRKAYNFVKYI